MRVNRHSGVFPYTIPEPSSYMWSDDPAPWVLEQWFGLDRFELTELFRRCGVGCYRTPNDLGRALLLDSLRGKDRHALPSLPCLGALKGSKPGLERHERLSERKSIASGDMRSAYPSFMRELPSYTAVRLRGWAPDWIRTWYMLCDVSIPVRLPLGFFPMQGQAPQLWQRQPGEYRTWLWKEQRDVGRHLGCFVRPVEGWGWEELTTDLAEWSGRVIALREAMPGGRSGKLGDAMKKVANRTIGCLGSGTTWLQPVKEENAREGDLPLSDPNEPLISDQWGRITRRPRTPVHWQRYCVMRCSMDTFWRALPYAERDELVRIKVDELEVAA